MDAITAATHVAQQSAAMVAAAVIDGQKSIELSEGSSGRPSVSSVVKFIGSHAKKQQIAGYCLAPIIKKILNDPLTDIDGDVVAEPALTSDKSYFRMVVTSLSIDQMEDYGKGEDQSACKLLQNILCSVAESDTDVFLEALGEFEKFGGTGTLNGIKNRFEQLCNKVTEVRFHSLFKLQKAVNKLSMVIKPMPHLVNEMFETWKTSPKSQATYSKIVKAIATELKTFKPKVSDKKGNDDRKAKEGKARDSWWSPQGKRGGGGGGGGGGSRNPSSGQSNTTQNALWAPNGVCRFFYNQGRCRFDDCKFEHTAPSRREANGGSRNASSVNHITELIQLRRQVRAQGEHIAEQNQMIEGQDRAIGGLTEELDQTGASLAERYSDGNQSLMYSSHRNPVV